MLTLLLTAHPEFNDTIFLGGSDEYEEDSWFWLDHKPWNYQNFQGSQPDGGEEENCLEMVSYDEDEMTKGWWNDIHCDKNKSRAFICAYDNGIFLESDVLKFNIKLY